MSELTIAEKAKLRAQAWRRAVGRLLVRHKTEFDQLYEEEKTKRGL